MTFTATQPDERTARRYWTMSRGDTDRAFRAARRHSRWVRFGRIALPIAVVLLLAVFGLWTWFNPMRLLLRIPDIGEDLVISGTKITMQAPRVSGFTRDGRPYELSARAAAQDLTQPDVVELAELYAKFQTSERDTTEIVAPSGMFNSKQEMLELGNNTVVTSTGGYKVLLDKPVIDIRAQQLTTSYPVKVETTQGDLRANSMQLLESGSVVRFQGVTMTITNPPTPPGGAR
jgi:lipopolysaccharide export system protein LptC